MYEKSKINPIGITAQHLLEMENNLQRKKD